MAKSKSSDYRDPFAKTLRELLERHPVHGGRTTYGKLGAALGVKPQSVSQWANGDTTPDMRHIAPLAEFFGVDCNFLLTGVSAENRTVWEDLGLHEGSVRFLKDLKALADRREQNSMAMLLIVDLFFRSGALGKFYDMINQYTYDYIEFDEAFERDSAAMMAVEDTPENAVELLRALNRVRAHETGSQFIWYKAAYHAREVMQMIVDRAGGFEEFESRVLLGNGRVVVVPEGFGDLAGPRTVVGGDSTLSFREAADAGGPPPEP
jgi:transcriptional regulator with XRE-family HTH domain